MNPIVSLFVEVVKGFLPYILAYFAGKNKVKAEVNEGILENVAEAKKIEDTVNSLSDSKFDRLRRKYGKSK
jgi:hypothetical protein